MITITITIIIIIIIIIIIGLVADCTESIISYFEKRTKKEEKPWTTFR